MMSPTPVTPTTKKGLIFTNAKLIDGTGTEPVPDAAVFVEGERITKITQTRELNADEKANFRVVDLQGKTLLPGLIEAHYHIGYWGVKELSDLDLKLAPEESTIYAVRNAELIMRCGYSSVCSAGAVHRVDVVVRNMIENGTLPGPRMVTSGRDISPTSGMLDWNPSYWKLGMEGLAIFADGADEVRKATRMIIKEDADIIKLYVTGEGLLRPHGPPEVTMMTEDEIAAATDEAHRRGRRVMAHVRGADGVKLCVKHGVDIVHHATFSDEEAIDIMVAHKDDIFVVPALGYTWGAAYKGAQFGIPEKVIDESLYREEFEIGCRNMRKLKDAGVRVLPGGDYGFVWCEHGEEAKDLEIFVKDIGFTPMEAIIAATKWGSQIMLMEDDIGTVEEGKYADLLVVDGDPLADITLFQDRKNIQLLMKGGTVMCNQLGLPQVLSEDYSLEEHADRVRRTDDYDPVARGGAPKRKIAGDRSEEYSKLLART